MTKNSCDFKCIMPKNVAVPVELYKSLRGEYYVGYADELTYGNYTSAWARLYNPCDSNVNLHVNVWTVTDISSSPFRAQIWFNTNPPGSFTTSPLVTPSNTALKPLPQPKVLLQEASEVTGDPVGGIKAFVRRGEPESTMVAEENGKFIFPPGGSFLVLLSNPENPEEKAGGRVAYGWWEEPITYKCLN